MNRKNIIITGIIVLAGVGAFIFYFYKNQRNNLVKNNSVTPSSSITPSGNDSFIQSIAQAPAVEGNIINSGIAGRVVLLGGGPYEYEASLEIFKDNNLSKPFISVRAHSDGTFQVPLRPDSYILRPMDPDGPIAPVRNNYPFTVGGNQWLQVKIEYK